MISHVALVVPMMVLKARMQLSNSMLVSLQHTYNKLAMSLITYNMYSCITSQLFPFNYFQLLASQIPYRHISQSLLILVDKCLWLRTRKLKCLSLRQFPQRDLSALLLVNVFLCILPSVMDLGHLQRPHIATYLNNHKAKQMNVSQNQELNTRFLGYIIANQLASYGFSDSEAAEARLGIDHLLARQLFSPPGSQMPTLKD